MNTFSVDAFDYTIGSLSLLASQPLPGYESLPDYPEEQPDTSVRDVEELDGWSGSRTTMMATGFGSDSFEARYRGDRGGGFSSNASVALSGVEAMGNAYSSSMATKKKNGDYDLDAFYDDEDEDDEDDSSEDDDSSDDEDDVSSEEEEDSDEEGDDSDEESSQADESSVDENGSDDEEHDAVTSNGPSGSSPIVELKW